MYVLIWIYIACIYSHAWHLLTFVCEYKTHVYNKDKVKLYIQRNLGNIYSNLLSDDCVYILYINACAVRAAVAVVRRGKDIVLDISCGVLLCCVARRQQIYDEKIW